MKRIFILPLLALFSIGQLFAGPISPQEAQKIAEAQLRQNGLRSSKAPLELTYTHYGKSQALRSASAPYYYIFNGKGQDGFVIVSADDRTAPVLAYNHQGNLNLNEAPEALRWWLSQFDKEYQWLMEHPETEGRKTATLRSEFAPIAPLLGDIQWDQNAPFNSECPKDPKSGLRSMVGCVATALGQVMRYHQWPKRANAATIEYNDYRSKQLRTYTFGKEAYDWAHMRGNFNTQPATDKEAHAIGYFLRDVGYACKMKYSSWESSAWEKEALIAVTTYFNYKNSASLAYRDGYTLDQWRSMIVKQLQAKKPLFYCGVGPDGGHAFVLDGYQPEGDFYHFNWGWNGLSDGYYKMGALIPGELGIGAGMGAYNMQQCILLDLEPNRDNNAGPEARPTAPFFLTRASIAKEGTVLKTRGFALQYAYNDGDFFINDQASIYRKGTNEKVLDIAGDKNKRLLFYYMAFMDYDIPITQEQYADGDYEVRFTWNTDKHPEFTPFARTNDEPEIVYFSVKDGKIVEGSIAYDNTFEPFRVEAEGPVALYSYAFSTIKLKLTNPNLKEYYGPVRLFLFSNSGGATITAPVTQPTYEVFVSIPGKQSISLEIPLIPEYSVGTQLYPYVQMSNPSRYITSDFIPGTHKKRLANSKAISISEKGVVVAQPKEIKGMVEIFSNSQGQETYRFYTGDESVEAPAFTIENRGEKSTLGQKDGFALSALVINSKGSEVLRASNALTEPIAPGAKVTYKPIFKNNEATKNAVGDKGYLIAHWIRVNPETGEFLSYHNPYKRYAGYKYPIYYAKGTTTEEVTVPTLAIYPLPAQTAINIVGGDAHEPLYLYALDGTLVSTHLLDATGVASLSVEHLAPAVYVVMYKQHAYKITVAR